MMQQKRWAAAFGVLLAVLLLAGLMPLRAFAGAAKQSGFGGTATAQNGLIEVDANGRGQFTVGTRGGDPGTAADDDRPLMYGHGSLRFTSFTTVRLVVDGQTEDVPLLRGTNRPPAEEAGGLTMGWLINGVAITQTLTPANNPYTSRPDTLRIALTATNATAASVSAGIRIMLDTMIGENDHAPFFVPGAGNFGTEREFTGDQVPAYWKAFEAANYDPASLKGQGILTGEDATRPDRLVFATWPNIKETAWDYRMDPNLPVGDSAVALYWEPKELAPGASATWVTYYGLAGAGGGNAWIDAPASITSDAPEFNATLWVTNLSDADFTGGEARIVLPQGLRLADGEPERKPLASVPVNGGAQSVSWRLVGGGGADATYPYSATATFQTGSGPLSADASVAYRFIAPAVQPTSPAVTPTTTPVPVVAPVAPAPEQPKASFPWWLLLLPLLLIPLLLLLLLRRQPARPATRVPPPRVPRAAPPPDFTERQQETGPGGANVTHGRKKRDVHDPNENLMG